MDAPTRELVRQRADGRCEYCRLRQEDSALAYHVDHIIAKQHLDSDAPENLAFACQECNYQKGPNLAGIDPETGDIVRLFHPRRDTWTAHFAFRGPIVLGLTPVGRATIAVLSINDARRLQARAELIELGELR